MIEVGIKIDEQKLKRSLNSVERKQFPYAMASALNKTAHDAQKAVRARTKRVFKLRAKRYILGGIQVKRTSKKEVRVKRYPYTLVYSGKRIEAVMNSHEKGETRLPKYKQNLAIPGRDLPKSFRSARGVKSRYKPETLLKDYQPRKSNRVHSSKPKVILSDVSNKKKRKGKGSSNVKKPFLTTFRKSGVKAIVQRKTKNRFPLKVYWILKSRAQIKDEWKFVKTARMRVQRVFKRNFRKAMRYALKTAR